MTRYLYVLLSILTFSLFVNYPNAYSTAQPELTKKEKRQVKRIAKKQAKKQINKKLPIQTKNLADNAVTAVKLNASVRPGGTLPAGTTLRGVFNPSDFTNPGGSFGSSEGVSFGGYQLPARPTVHVIDSGGPTDDCPGTFSAPDAEAGHLCLYVGAATAGSVIVAHDATTLNGISYNVSTNTSISFGDGKVSQVGFGVEIVKVGGNGTEAAGTWAVKS